MNVVDVSKARRFSPEKMQKINLFDTPRVLCDVYCLEPGQTQKPHTHADSDKIYYVLEGSGKIRIGDEIADLPAQHAVLAPAGIEHGVINDSAERLVLFVVAAPKFF